MLFSCTGRWCFRLDYDPADMATSQQKGVRIVRTKGGGRIPMFFKKDKVRKTEKALSILLAVEKHKRRIPTISNDGDTAVKLRIVYFFGHTSGTPKWKREQVTFMTQRPDADNLSKSLVDCMTKCGYWDDDSMVNFEFSKYRAPHHGIMIVLERWKQEKESPENAMKNAQSKQLPNCSPTVS